MAEGIAARSISRSDRRDAVDQLAVYLFGISARPFQRRTHQRNVIKGLATHLVRHHGPHAIAPDIAQRFPELVRASRKGLAR
ncbi:hypothetical protein [Pelagibacterium sp.]|uniref:hypothetical protein n=1 Tax=Pelagibacterium sp. TaxID=1967288 RepID=UPI003A938D07